MKNLPANLPSEVASSFQKVSKLAYTALVEGKMIVDEIFLQSQGFEIPTTENSLLGLLRHERDPEPNAIKYIVSGNVAVRPPISGRCGDLSG